ncbi:MAG TPA: class I SAM-dependent methyltransferase [Solirubrobacterales bacterium]|nr:class I SAM-dependent methyltransferase [Solirubrobacterales bacterium]
MAQGDAVRAAYEACAGIYDRFTGSNDYEMWFGELLPRLEELGLRHGELLDVACGTGKGIGPMLARGWRVTACDISAAMVERAREKFPEGVRFEVCDMRELPRLGEFDLVWAMNDPVNYLVEDDDLGPAFAAMGANLGPAGLLVFDCNTARLFRETFAAGVEENHGDRWTWRGLGGTDDVYEAEISGEEVEPNVHRERYWPVEVIRAALAGAGLVPVAAIGQREVEGGLVLSPDWDEDRDHKIIHVAKLAA